MKTYFFITLLSLSLLTYAQKAELKELKKAFKKSDYTTLRTLADKYQTKFDAAESKYRDKYNVYKASAYYNLSKKNLTDFNLLDQTIEAFKPVKGNSDMQKMRLDLVGDIHKSTLKFYEDKDYSKTMQGFEKIYRLSPVDTIYLYSAASVGLGDKELYDKALVYYRELVDLGYDGSGTTFYAVNKASGKKEGFMTKKIRDLNVKIGTHEKPEDVKEPSKKPEIIKNIALILIQQGKEKEALEAIDKAIEKSPDDIDLLLNKANLYYKMEKKDEYKNIIRQVIEKDPKNPDLYYNLGVVSGESKDYDEALNYYKKALEIDSNMVKAVLNISSAYLEKGNMLVQEMNDISDRKKHKKINWKKYDKLKERKNKYFKESAKFLEKYLKENPESSDKIDLLSQLKNIYGILGDNANFKRIKGLIKQK